MPIITIQMLEGRITEQKSNLARAITDDVVRILDVPPEDVRIIYYEIPKTSFAKAGVLASRTRK